jgi:GNAT superfamily N-acetyltransferase
LAQVGGDQYVRLMTRVDAPVRRLDVAEVQDCLDLGTSRGWAREDHKWRFLFEVGEVYGIDAPDGGLAGVVVLTRYGTELAGIGMMLVAERFGRQGLGTRLMQHALDEAKTATVWLTATKYGRPLYEKLGFRAIGVCSMYLGDFDVPAPMTTRPASTKDTQAILELDAGVFGAPRADVLTRLPEFAEQIRVVDGPDGLLGYAAAWRNVGSTVIGPVVADSTAVAWELIVDLLAGITGPVRLDIDPDRPGLREWIEAQGVQRVGDTAVMVYGASLPGDRDRLFVPLTVAMG